MLYISGSNAIYRHDPSSGDVHQILSTKHSPGFFSPRGKGFFGICRDERSGDILVASRETLGTPGRSKRGSDVKLFSINPRTHAHQQLLVANDVHDVHQIACYERYVFMTDTGRNRVRVYDLDTERPCATINVGAHRDDQSHLNALLVIDGDLLIGLNNQGKKDAEILRLSLQTILDAGDREIDAKALGATQVVPGVRHSHDLIRFGDRLLVSASHDCAVVRADSGEAILSGEAWTRGIAYSADTLWVGSSMYAKRAKRHAKKMDGYVLAYDHNFEPQGKITAPGAGQINDLLWVED